MSRTTASIIIAAACGAAALLALLLSIWFYHHHKQRQHTGTSRRGDYKKLQKRNHSRSPQPDFKHLSTSTTFIVDSSRSSTTSISDYQKHDLADLEAQQTEHHSQSSAEWQSQAPIQIRRDTSLSSEYSFRPEHLSKVALNPMQLPLQPDVQEQNLSAIGTNIPLRAPSTRVPTYHTDAEYSTLISEDVQALMNSEPPTPPPIPRRSSRRSSEPTSIDARLAASISRKAGLSVPEQSRLRPRSI